MEPEGGAAKVFVLGLDGATLDVLGPLLDGGHLPHLKALAGAGARGTLFSTVPPTSPVAWSTFVTGKNPGKHGIYDFLEFSHNPLGGRVNSSRAVKGRTIWEIATRAGLRVVVGGVPLTYPPRPRAGLLIGDFLSPRGVPDLCSDPPVLLEMERTLGPYEPWCTASYHRGNELAVLRRLRAFLDYHLSAIQFLLDRRPWDLFCYNLMAVDRLQHELWHVFDESHPFRKGRDLRQAHQGFLAFFRAIDEALGAIRRRLPPSCNLLVLSDHGNGPVTHYLNLNLWLLGEGYIVLRPGRRVALKRWLFERGKNPAWAYRRLARLGFADLVQGRLRGGQLGRLDRVVELLFLSKRDIDWSRTRAYAQGNYGQVFLNLKGRQPEGPVDPGTEAESLKEEIRRKLLALPSPEDGQPLVREVRLPEQDYRGPLTHLAPDMRVEMRDPRHHTVGLFDFTSHKLLMRAFSMSGDHRPEGILFAAGPSILAGSAPCSAQLCDLAPTILHLLQLPIPRDMDGRVLEEILAPGPAPLYTETSAAGEDDEALARERREIAAEVEAEVRERLRNLGYL